LIESLKDLEKLLKLCRKQGVTEIKLGVVELKLGDLPTEQTVSMDVSDDPYKSFPQGELTPEQLMFYSAGGVPENDPELNKAS
jgi:hypothetical protein